MHNKKHKTKRRSNKKIRGGNQPAGQETAEERQRWRERTEKEWDDNLARARENRAMREKSDELNKRLARAEAESEELRQGIVNSNPSKMSAAPSTVTEPVTGAQPENAGILSYVTTPFSNLYSGIKSRIGFGGGKTRKNKGKKQSKKRSNH